MKYVYYLGLLCLLSSCSGAGGGTAISGKVSFGDGSPVPKGAVSISNEDGSFRGAIGSDGTYTIEGVTKGQYAVTIAGVMDSDSEEDMNYDDEGNYVEPDPSDEPKNLILAKYSNSEDSGLTLTVPGDYDLTVEKAE